MANEKSTLQVYCDFPLKEYISIEARKKLRKLTAEVTELIEIGIATRDGQKAMDKINKERGSK